MPLYCPHCDAEVPVGALGYSRCPATFSKPGGWKPIERSAPVAKGGWYAVGALLAPFAAFFCTFAVLCLYECLVTPWLTLFLTPIVTLFFWLALGSYVRRRAK